jgi:hypothetical protein
MTEGISDREIITRLQEVESSLWETLLEKQPFSLFDIGALIQDPQYMAAVGISRRYSDDIEAFRRPSDSYSGDNYSGCESKEFSDEELLSLAKGGRSTRSMENFFDPLVLDLRVLRGQSRDSSQNIGPERVETVICLARVDRLLKSIPAIQQMQRAQDEIDNPALKTRVARNVFSALDPYTQQTVREVFKEVRQERNRLYATMGEGQIFPKDHPNPDQASAAAFQEQQSQMSRLDGLLMFSKATRPASQEQRITETLALLKKDPAGTIRSGINHVTESVLASCANRLGLARFFSTSRDHTQ